MMQDIYEKISMIGTDSFLWILEKKKSWVPTGANKRLRWNKQHILDAAQDHYIKKIHQKGAPKVF